jgi:hypothetical protein
MCKTPPEMRAYLNAQIDAFNEWVWCFGVDTGMDLREYFNDDELMHIWITRYASEFHDTYKSELKNDNR